MGLAEEVDDVEVTEDDRATARVKVQRSTHGIIVGALAGQLLVHTVAGLLVISLFVDLSAVVQVLVVGVVATAILAPFVWSLSFFGSKRSTEQLARSLARERIMTAEARQREFETRLGNALEMSNSEESVLSTVKRALRDVTGDARVEILLADNSQSHLEQALVSGADPDGPSCQADSPESCAAARRSQTQTFTDSDALDACPHLQDRVFGPCSAVCVPVSIMGRTVGVVHLAEPIGVPLPDNAASQLEVLANQIGVRLAMLRGVKETKHQASTDELTGLLNRRAFENEARRLRSSGATFAVAMIDLDHFKVLNDSYGHETGDRALRVFSNVLQTSVRQGDAACRYGGEEFVVALPECDAAEAIAMCERVRESLALVAQSGSTPPFTASFGVAEWSNDLTLQQLISRADEAMFQAKHAGRNRAFVYGQAVALEQSER